VKERLADAISLQIRASNLQAMVIEDSEDTLISFYTSERKLPPQSGYISYRDGKPVVLISQDNQSRYQEQKALPSLVRVLLHTRKPSVPDVSYIGSEQAVIMEMHAPIVSEYTKETLKTVGFLHAAFVLDDSFIDDISKATGSNFYIYLSDGGILGTAQPAPVVDNFTKIPLLAEGEGAGNVFGNISTADSVCGAARVAGADAQQIVYVFCNNKRDREISKNAYQKSVVIVLLISSLLIIPAIYYFLNSNLFLPIEALLSGVKRISAGRYEIIPEFSRDDELSVLAYSFNAMTREIQLKITQLNESEERYAKAAHLAQVGHWLFDDANDMFLYCSEELASIFGMTVEEFMASNAGLDKYLEHIHEDDRVAYADAIRDSQKPGASRQAVEYRIRRADGVVRFLREEWVPISDGGENTARSYGTSSVAAVPSKRPGPQVSRRVTPDALSSSLRGGDRHPERTREQARARSVQVRH